MILEIQHETTLDYTHAIKEWLAEVRMEPVSDTRQTCHSFHVGLSQPAQVFRYLDGFGNRVHHFNLIAPHQQIRVLAASVVETAERPADLLASQALLPLELDGSALEVFDLLTLRGPVRSTTQLDPILADLRPRPGQRLGMWLYQVGDYITSRFKYARDVTDASSPIDDLLRYGKGVCQDFAHLMLAIGRSYGVPSRYVSGYIHRPNKESQSHAWCEFWLPDLGWMGFDPTNGCPTNERFVKVAIGRDFTDVPPNKGTYRGQGEERISVRVASRQLDRLPSLSWQEHLPPLDVPATAILRFRHHVMEDDESQQQQQ
jgi:transglutaminase-like putative cysteine protease